ncbi:glutathione synthase [Methylophilus rhizosphaerae]|uniref:Glutathione synthetase n=1 Tax=Methylophilus rhizosphaerae TaxID=492660 RepID=A0A1G9ECQ1_9PROT|nr:glutathione synthase [Methylophilus rhizosphaerae]SDK73939.1 glutathione synthase [Methylophilus rhizosphaerae]
MKLLLILDPLDSLITYKDTSLAIMRAAQARGHDLWVCEQHDWQLQHDVVTVDAQTFAFNVDGSWKTSDKTTVAPTDFDAVLMRKDPPFDNEYLYSTYLLELAQQQGARIINDPAAIRGWNEKLSVARFPQFAPPFIVTSQQAKILAFLAEHGDIIVKPLDGMGGSGIFRLRKDDPNIYAILETLTRFQTQTIMVQRYIPEIIKGDKRILVINGEPLPYALARIPKSGETRGNLAAGGKGIAQPLSARDRQIAETVGKVLMQHGLFLVGLDVIGDYLTEVNVTSPTGMVEITAQSRDWTPPCDPAMIMVQALEKYSA